MPGRWRDRSRSPAIRETQSTKYLSKMLAGFGRYARNRPEDLRVCSQGSFTLSNLMDAWATREGYTRKEILNAVRVHMFHEDGSSLRFSIEQTRGGDTIIRVQPKRGERTEPRERTERSERSGRGHGSDAGRRPAGPSSEPPSSPKNKLDMTLDDLIRTNSRGGEARTSVPSSSSTDFYERAQRVTKKAAQMGLTPETKHIREAPLSSCLDEGMGVPEKKPNKVRPLPKKAPFPPPPPKEVLTALKASAKAKSQAARQYPELIMSKAEPVEVEPDFGEEAEGEGEAPPGPPGPFWEKYDDPDGSWWHYSGPRGVWCCAGIGLEVLPSDSISLT